MNTHRYRLLKLVLLGALVLGACRLPFQADEATDAPPEKPPRATAEPATAIPAPSETPVPPAAPALTEPALPEITASPEVTFTPTVLFTVGVTFTPTFTSMPGVSVRIRNMSGNTLNLYRFGRSGELHFLGWLGHGYYGIFRFPDLGEWRIRYCERDIQGNSFSCQNKKITVEKDDQEFVVP